jgi:hypothetical protein
MASIFFTERLPGISIFQSAALSTWRLARWLFEGFLAASPSPLMAGGPDDPEQASRAGFLARVGFLKSRVYAKL